MELEKHNKEIEDNFKAWALGIYWFYIIATILSFITVGFFALVAFFGYIASVMVAFHQKKSSGGTIYQSHFENYIAILWLPLRFFLVLGVLAAIVGLASMAVEEFEAVLVFLGGVGIVGLIVWIFWSIWRVVKGILQVKDGLAYNNVVVKIDHLTKIERNKYQIDLGEIGGKDKNSDSDSYKDDSEEKSTWQEEEQNNRVVKNEIDSNASKIDALHKGGVLSDTEYAAAKSRIAIENDPHLIELGILHKKGVLSDADYEAAKNRIVSELGG